MNDIKAFIQSILKVPADKREFTFVIHFNHAFAGLIGFKNTDKLNRKTEIGNWLSHHFQKKGIITKSVKSLMDFAFNELDINRIQIKCATENISSRKIPRKLGFTFEGTECDGELLSNGIFTDIEVYSKLRNEFDLPYQPGSITSTGFVPTGDFRKSLNRTCMATDRRLTCHCNFITI